MEPKNRSVPTKLSHPVEIAGYLIEEFGEVLHALGKSIRFGFYARNLHLPVEEQITNVDWLRNELKDLKYAVHVFKEAFWDE